MNFGVAQTQEVKSHKNDKARAKQFGNDHCMPLSKISKIVGH